MDGESILGVTCTSDTLALTNFEHDWTQEYQAAGPDTYDRTSDGWLEDDVWYQTVTLIENGFVGYSELTSPELGWVDQPCFRYTYVLIDE